MPLSIKHLFIGIKLSLIFFYYTTIYITNELCTHDSEFQSYPDKKQWPQHSSAQDTKLLPQQLSPFCPALFCFQTGKHGFSFSEHRVMLLGRVSLYLLFTFYKERLCLWYPSSKPIKGIQPMNMNLFSFIFIPSLII